VDELRWSGVLEQVEEGRGIHPARYRRKEAVAEAE
jgi:hypothetical protein